MLDFIKKVENKIQPTPSAYDGMRVVEMVHALYQASKTNKTIKL